MDSKYIFVGNSWQRDMFHSTAMLGVGAGVRDMLGNDCECIKWVSMDHLMAIRNVLNEFSDWLDQYKIETENETATRYLWIIPGESKNEFLCELIGSTIYTRLQQKGLVICVMRVSTGTIKKIFGGNEND